MEEENKTNNQEEMDAQTIQAIKEGYEAKIEQIKQEMEQDKQNALAEQEKRHASQIKALLLGREEFIKQQKVAEETEEEKIIARLTNKYKY